jgi:hypothetical protein
MTQLTPVQLLQYTILELQANWDDSQLPTDLTGEQIDDLWDEADCLTDAMSEIRTSGTSTGLDSEYCRHYESEAVAVQAPNGQWVGFTYWYGGGKHGEPGALEWIAYAYHVTCKEERKMVTVQTFTQGEE